MSLSLKWVWELTPRQVFEKNKFVKTAVTAKLWQETRAFDTPRKPLAGTEFMYQLALTSKGRNEEAKLLRAQHPDLPDSGNYRSGVLIFDEDKVIASLVLSGVNEDRPFKMVVNPEYRGQDLAERLLVEWWSNVRHTYRESGSQPLNVASVKVLLKAYRKVVLIAGADGKTVPNIAVINAEAEQVLEVASEAEEA